MIKIGIRNNLFFPFMSIIFTYARKIETILMGKIIGFNGSLLLTLIMFLSEIISGIIFFLYEKKYFTLPKKRKTVMSLEIKLKENSDEIKPNDTQLTIYLYIFVIAYIDFFEFMVDTLYIPKYKNISDSLFIRLKTILTLCSGIISLFLLKFSIYKHQKFSLLMIFFCLISVIIVEYIFMESNTNFFFVLFLIFMNYFFDSFFDVIEKYLLDFDFINRFKLIFLEGIFGFILTSFYSFVENPFKEIKAVYEEKKYKFYLLINFLVIYFLLCAGRNIYRVMTNKMYFPITRSLTDSILDPLLLIYYYLFENDFYIKSKNEQNIIFFLINLFLSLTFVFFGCVYNEVLVLQCCELDYDTYYQVSRRATSSEVDEMELIENLKLY